ncbi:hypothetical protein M378DRAFT_851866 [Amanita muscaria Koide BX008]|uniref:Uncharacterized protein n=1 Tax=Amanita muscaria (strain Koide BX008) TaxID=946122 RepID=A0A0C2T4Z1_AMAMK|nr:hypothetical protein M378DRAFT_851866 [Amanita muscaria Koide BX008]
MNLYHCQETFSPLVPFRFQKTPRIVSPPIDLGHHYRIHSLSLFSASALVALARIHFILYRSVRLPSLWHISLRMSTILWVIWV